jgi:hypothetical protein
MNTSIILYQTANLEKIVEKAKNSTVLELFKSNDRVNLQKLNNVAKKETNKLLSVILLKLFSDMGVEKQLTADWFEELADIIQERFIMLSVEDVVKCSRCIKAGDYGKNYNNFTMQYIVECLSIYQEDLISIIEEEKEREKKEFINSIPLEVVKRVHEKLRKGEYVETKKVDTERELHRKALKEYLLGKGSKRR